MASGPETRFRALLWIVVVLGVVFICLQFIRPELTSPPVTAEVQAPAGVKQVLAGPTSGSDALASCLRVGFACSVSAAGGAASPGCEDFVCGCRGDGGFGDGEESASDEPAYG